VDRGNTWPEQEVIEAWAQRHGIKASNKQLMELKEEMTKLSCSFDKARLVFLAGEVFDQIGDVDVHEQAFLYASAFGREEPNNAVALSRI